jgi:hypothetical protein
MKKLNRMFAVVLVFSISSCQKRTLCKAKTTTGSAFVRLYANNYDGPDDYQAAIDTLKAQGYTCDDTDAFSN